VDEDFNNVQDQNLVDDQMANQIAGDNPVVANVGSVVHPTDPAPASQVPRVPTAQELLGDKIDEVAANAVSEPAPVEEPSVDIPEPDIEVPEPEIKAEPEPEIETSPEPATPNTDDAGFIAPPDESAQDDNSSDDDDDAEEQKVVEDKPKMDTSHLDGGVGDDDELMDVKQQALEELSPLVSHLDLPPEQKFDTYMEILRASDDKTLVKPALDAAKAIEDDDKRAQALLDVVNEVNYLTQDHN
jgi:hypothetical protein